MTVTFVFSSFFLANLNTFLTYFCCKFGRFSKENVDSIPPYVYLPFGAGPRNCIGVRLGLRAVKMALFHSICNVEFVRTAKTKVPLELFKGFGVISSSDITVGVRKRTS